MLILMIQRVSSRVSGFPLASPCLWGKLQNLSVSMGEVTKQVVMRFCVAGVALRDILTCLQTCRKSFCVTCAILLQGFQQMSCIFAADAAFWRPPSSFCVAQHFWHVVLHVIWESPCQGCVKWWHSTLNTLHFSFTCHTPHSTLYTPHSTLHTSHFTLHTPHFTLHTQHFTLHTLHSTLRTLHSTLHTLHFTL